MTRVLNPATGQMDDVDPSIAPLYEELWARLGCDAPGAALSESQTGLVSEAKQSPHPGPQRPAAVRTASRPRPERLIVPWEPAELGRVRSGLPGRYQLMTDLGSALGLRQGELFGFNLQDLDPGMTTYRVRVQVKRVPGGLVFAPPKHGRERSVPVPPGLRQRIREHIATWGTVPVSLPWEDLDGPPRMLMLAFTSQHATALDRAYVNRLWKTAVVAAGITWIPQDTGFHMLRHIAASEWIAAGADVLQVRDLLGHADLETTQRYLHRLKTHDRRTRTVVAKAQRRTAPRPAPLPAGVADFGAYRNRRTMTS